VDVTFIDHTSDMGGAEHNLLNLATTLKLLGVRPRVLTTPGGGLVARLAAREIPVEFFALPERTRFVGREQLGSGLVRLVAERLPDLAGAVRDLRRALTAKPVDIVQTNSLKAHVLGSLAAWGTGVPVVWHLQDLVTERGNGRPLLELMAALVQPRIVCISGAVRADLGPRLAARATVIPNGIDDGAIRARLSGQDVRAAFGIPPGVPLVGIVAHLIPWKGHRHLLAALARLGETFPTLHCLVVGGEILQWAGQQQALEKEARRLGVHGRVIFTGLRDDVPDLIAALDVLVLASENEPFGLVLLEAMALGKPLVATRGGGVPEIVRDGETGTLVPVADPAALAAALARYLEDPRLRQQTGEAGRALVARRFGLQQMAAGFLSLYKAIALGP